MKVPVTGKGSSEDDIAIPGGARGLREERCPFSNFLLGCGCERLPNVRRGLQEVSVLS